MKAEAVAYAYLIALIRLSDFTQTNYLNDRRKNPMLDNAGKDEVCAPADLARNVVYTDTARI